MLADLNRLLAKAGTLGATAAAGQSVPTSLDAATRTKIEKSVKQADLDVWTGKTDHALRRIRVNVRFDVPANLRSDKTKPEKGTIALDLTIAGLNEPQAIGAPANPKPIGDLTAALQQVLAQAQGGAAGPARARRPLAAEVRRVRPGRRLGHRQGPAVRAAPRAVAG